MKFYNKEVNLPDVLGNLGVSGFRLLTVSTSPLSAGNVTNNNYEVYYIDSEWGESPSGGFLDGVVVPAADVGFGDGLDWHIASTDVTTTNTVQFIVVRKSDRKTILFHGDADGTTSMSQGTWTFTDVTGEVWHEGLRKLRILGYV